MFVRRVDLQSTFHSSPGYCPARRASHNPSRRSTNPKLPRAECPERLSTTGAKGGWARGSHPPRQRRRTGNPRPIPRPHGREGHQKDQSVTLVPRETLATVRSRTRFQRGRLARPAIGWPQRPMVVHRTSTSSRRCRRTPDGAPFGGPTGLSTGSGQTLISSGLAPRGTRRRTSGLVGPGGRDHESSRTTTTRSGSSFSCWRGRISAANRSYSRTSCRLSLLPSLQLRGRGGPEGRGGHATVRGHTR
jgi:hypothetical protein